MKKILTHLPILFFLIIFQTSTFAQTDAVREAFDDAEFFYLQEDFKEALSSYLKVYKRGYQKNANINFRIGVCYLNTTAEKEKAIPYLELASKKTNKTYTEGSLEEVNAPIDVCLYLGNAYRINGQLDNAIKAYESYIQRVEDKTSNEIDFAKQQIKSCNRAKELINKPIKVKITNIGKPINTSKANYSPFISSDGKTLAYMSSQAFYEAVMIARENNGKWTTDNINPEIQSDGYHEVESLSPDGNTLFLTVHDNFESDIYISKYNGKTWSKAKKIDKTINSKEWESHVSISGDGKQLYIASNRKGSLGGVDIFVSDLDYSGEWGEPRNIGKEINTPLNEDNPFITTNDSALYFCSEGHNSMGGYDNFKSRRINSEWKKAENLGFPINTTDDDKFFQPANNGMNAFYSMKTDYKKRDIFYLGLGGLDVNQIYEINGNFRLNDASLDAEKTYSINILNKTSGDTLYKGSPDKTTGLYIISVAPGSFRLAYSAEGYFTRSIDTTIVQDNPELMITLDVTLERDSSLIEPVVYEKINLSAIPIVAAIDSSILIKNMNVSNVDDVIQSDVLYFTVQVMALRNPVDVSYFKHISNMKVMYNEVDKFYRYTTGRFTTREEAEALRKELIRKGYPAEIFIKKVSK